MSLDLTIVIVNWNGGSLLMRCLESIRAHNCSRGVTVIVVDNDSTDGSRESAAALFPEFQILNSGGNLGFGRGNNLARPLTHSPYVLFLNPDTELIDGALDRALECFDRYPDVGAVGCRMLEPDGSVHQLGLQWSMSPLTALAELLLVTGQSRHVFRRWLPTIDPARSGYVKKLYGGFLLVRKATLDAAGWFDERYFMYAEDADLSRTIRSLGWTLYYCSEAVIMHVGGGATAGAPSTFSYLMKQESINKLIAKYQGWPAAILHRVAVCVGGLTRLVVVVGARLISAPANETSRLRWKTSCLKHQQLVLWSLGLRKAAAPVSRPQRPL
jgi:GT2 family glycosyltransferase